MVIYLYMLRERERARRTDGTMSMSKTPVPPSPGADGNKSPNRFKMEPAWKDLTTNNVHVFLTAQASTLADGAVFIIGACACACACAFAVNIWDALSCESCLRCFQARMG